MPITPLPDQPSVAQLRKRAKDLRRAFNARNPAVVAPPAEHVGGQALTRSRTATASALA